MRTGGASTGGGIDSAGAQDGSDDNAGLRVSPQQVGTALSKLVSASIGEIAVLMSRSPEYRDLPLSVLQSRVLPPVLAKQFYVTEVMDKESGHQAPLAAITWACVSDDVDQRLASSTSLPIQIQPDEWTSGAHVWIADIVGDPRGIGFALKVVVDGPLKGRTIKIASPDGNGRVRIDLISDLLDAVAKHRGSI